MFKVLMVCGVCMGLAACAGNPVLVAASCPPFPKPPESLMQDPPTLDLVPPSLRPLKLSMKLSGLMPP